MQGARYYKVIFMDKVESMELAYDALDAWNCALIRRSSELDSGDCDESTILPRVKSVEGVATTREDRSINFDSAAKAFIQDMFRELEKPDKPKTPGTRKPK